MTTREIDDLLFGLLGRVDGDARHLGFVEPAILIFDHCLGEIGTDVCDQNIRFHAHSMMHALRPEVIPTLHYRVLKALPAVLGRIAASSPEALPEDSDDVDGAVERTLARYRRLLGEEPGGIDASIPGSGSGGAPGRDGVRKVDLAMVWQYGRNGHDFSLGKNVGARLDLVIAGEWSLTRTFDPLVAFSGRIREHDDPFARQLRNAVAIAEDRFGRAGVREMRRLPREYLFRISEEDTPPDWLRIFTGGSAGLALTLLAMRELDTLNVRRQQRILLPDVTFTGEVDGEGNVLAVDGDGIGPKVEAAFYSPCRTFVLPRGNLDRAGESLDGLRRMHPNRDLELLPVETVDEAYEDHRVTAIREVPRLRVSAARVRRRRKTLIAGFMTLAVAVLVGILLPPRFAREIVTYDFDGNSIRFYNRYGYNFDRYDVPYYIKTVNNDYSNPIGKSHRLVLGDADGDTLTNELIFISVESNRGRKSPHGRIHVHLFSSEGKLVRHIPTIPEITCIHPDTTFVYKNFGYYYDIEEDVDGDGFKEVLISFADLDFYPSGIINVSLSRGDYQCFFHPGHMIRFVTGDFDGDGKVEIVAAGEMNGAPSGVVAVLDPSHMHGMTPLNAERYPEFAEDVARYYILIPRSELRDLREGIQKPFIDTIIRDDRGRLRIGALEDSESDGGNALWYYLGPDWRCEEVVETDAYIAAYALGISGESVKARLQKQAERLKGEFRYYSAGSGLSNTPIINEGYLAARDKQHSDGGDSVRN